MSEKELETITPEQVGTLELGENVGTSELGEDDSLEKVGVVKSLQDGKTLEKDILQKPTQEVEVEEAKPAIVADDTVICRGRNFGGSTKMKRSEFQKLHGSDEEE